MVHQETTVLRAEDLLVATALQADHLGVTLAERAVLRVEVQVQDREAVDHKQDAHEKDSSFFLDLAVAATGNGAE